MSRHDLTVLKTNGCWVRDLIKAVKTYSYVLFRAMSVFCLLFDFKSVFSAFSFSNENLTL